MFAVGSRAAGIDWVLSLKRAKLGENAHVLINPRGFCGAYPVLFGARARPSRVPILPNVGQKDPRRTRASDRLLRGSFAYLRVEDERDAAIAFQNSEFVLYVLFAASLERCLSAMRRTAVNWDVREPENGRRKIFIWIRRNPLKSPDSAKEMKGNESFFPWISLHFLARTRPVRGPSSPRR
jgi:hypothetical protein